MSLRASAGSPRNCSGARYASVPATIPGAVSDCRDTVVASANSSSVSRFARPKSSTFTWSSGVMTMLALLRSRWTTPRAVRVCQRIGHLLAIAEDLVDGQRALRHTRAQRLPFDQLHRDERLAVRFANLVNRADVRVIQLRGEPRLAHQVRPRRLVSTSLGTT